MLAIFLVFGLSFWLGCYLWSKDPHHAPLRWTAWGLITYAIGILAATFADLTKLGSWLQIENISLLLPALCWTGTLLQLIPEEQILRARALRVWHFTVLPISLTFIILYALLPNLATRLLVLFVLLPSFGAALLVWRDRAAIQTQHNLRLMLTVGVMLALSTALYLMPNLLVQPLSLYFIGIDMLILGLSLVWHDALDQGEVVLPDMVGSLLGTLMVSGLLVSQVMLVVAVQGQSNSLLALIFGVLSASVLIQTLSQGWQTWLDRLMLQEPKRLTSRAELRGVSQAMLRSQSKPDVRSLSDADFDKLSRRALSHFGDLSRLAASPLCHLPIIGIRLDRQGSHDGSLERARILKELLLEGIAQLKPASERAFDTTSEWRFYNVLYFPYVIGLKPFSQRMHLQDVEAEYHDVLEWFRTHVPERTYYNWQKAAAQLVAKYLKEQDSVEGEIPSR